MSIEGLGEPKVKFIFGVLLLKVSWGASYFLGGAVELAGIPNFIVGCSVL